MSKCWGVKTRTILKGKRTIIYSLLVMILILMIGFSACSEPVTVTITPNQNKQTNAVAEPTTTTAVSSTSLYSTALSEAMKDGAITESDTGTLVVAHLYDLATTYEKKMLLAELIDSWGISDQYATQEGGWVQFHLDSWEVQGNEILEPILGIQNDYHFEWNVTPNGLSLIPRNGNAIKIEAEFTK